MTTAFQQGAFQENAFQIDASGVCQPAFQRVAFQQNAFQQCGASTAPTWGTFPPWPKRRPHYPEWWPTRKKKIERELEDRIDAIVEAAEPKAKRSPPLAAALAEIRRLEGRIVQERLATSEIRRQVEEALTARRIRLTNESASVLDKVSTATRQAETEVEQMEVDRKRIRRKKIMHILKMLH